MKEITAPADHDMDLTVFTVEIGTNGSIIRSDLANNQVVNNFHSASITITAIDDETGLPMAGVTYVLYDENGVERGTAVTDGGGQAVFSSVMVGLGYSMEVVTPGGFYPAQPMTISALSLGDDFSETWQNFACEGMVSATVMSSGAGNALLSGVRFGIYAADDPDVALAEAVSDEFGQIQFFGLPLKTSGPATFNTPPTYADNGLTGYIIKETNLITGYLPVAAPFAFAISADEPTLADVGLEKDPQQPASPDPDDYNNDVLPNSPPAVNPPPGNPPPEQETEAEAEAESKNGNGNGNGNGSEIELDEEAESEAEHIPQGALDVATVILPDGLMPEDFPDIDLNALQHDPFQPGGTIQEAPPVPNDENYVLFLQVDADGNIFYIEFSDMDGMPLGHWMWDDETGEWIYEIYTPFGSLPRTGTVPINPFVLIFGVLASVLGILLILRKPDDQDKTGSEEKRKTKKS